MDNIRERIEALEQQMRAMGAHTHTVERRLRWWQGVACGVIVLGLLSGVLPSGTTVDAQQGGLPARVAALEDKLVAVTFNSANHELVLTGANLRIVNGLGETTSTNGLGNLIVGYNELRASVGTGTDDRTGSHNVVVGQFHNFSSYAGLVVGDFNEISGVYASVSGGAFNTASGDFSSVSGGFNNTASSNGAAVSGGGNNTAGGSVSSISGGFKNTASGPTSSISGGENNTASGAFSSVSGGSNRTAPGTHDWVAGPLFADN